MTQNELNDRLETGMDFTTKEITYLSEEQISSILLFANRMQKSASHWRNKYAAVIKKHQQFRTWLQFDVLPSLVAPRNRAAIGYAFNAETTLMSVDMAWNQFVQGNGVNGEVFDYDTKRSDKPQSIVRKSWFGSGDYTKTKIMGTISLYHEYLDQGFVNFDGEIALFNSENTEESLQYIFGYEFRKYLDKYNNLPIDLTIYRYTLSLPLMVQHIEDRDNVTLTNRAMTHLSLDAGLVYIGKTYQQLGKRHKQHLRSDDDTLKSEFFKTYPLEECWTKEEITIHTVGKADQFEIENSVIECHTSHCINSTGEDYEPNLEIPEHRNLYDLVDEVMIERCRITNTQYTLHPSHLLLTQ